MMAMTQEQSANGSSSIPLPEIPVKLRCTICSELARGASRLPCCEQSICESCHTNLPNVCPVCDHSPLSPDDCKANTALRTTVAVFLRTAEKKHNLLQQKEQKEKTKPIESKTEAKNAEPESDKTVPVHVSPVQNPLTPPQEVDESTGAEGQQALPQVSQENAEAPVEQTPTKAHGTTPASDVEQANGFVDQQNAWFNHQGSSQVGNIQQMQQMQQMFPGHDFSGPNGWNVYNQVMQEMQGGWMGGYGNMMEYPMNSAVVQGGGFGGGGFGNMGMNGGFHNGHDGMGWSGWNGQNNVGFNPGMEGTRNGGYYSAASAGGYNHQSHGNLQMPTQQYQNHHFQRQQPYPRGGRGGFVGGARQYSHERQQQQAFQDTQFSQQLQGIDEAVAAVVGSSGDEKKGEKIPSVVSGDPENIADPNDVPTDTSSTVLAGADPVTEEPTDSLNPPAPVNPDMAQYFPTDDFRGPNYQTPFYPTRGNFRGNFRGGYRGDFGIGSRGGGVHNVVPIPSVLGDQDSDKIPGVGLGVEGAPTGPKALREGIQPVRGIPNRGVFGRGRGVYTASSWTRSISPGRVRAYSRSRSRRRSSATGRDRSRDPSHDHRRKSRSRNRDRSRHRKQSSPSIGSDGESRGRTPKRGSEEPISLSQDKELIDMDIGEPNSIDISQPAPAIRNKRSRENSGSRDRERSASRSRSRSADRHHKRSRRDRDRRVDPVTESRDREDREKENRDKENKDREGRDKGGRDKGSKDKESRDRDGSSRYHRRSHKHKSSRKHRSRSRSRSTKKDDYPVEDKTTVRDIDGANGRARRDSRERERRHKRRSKREESRHRPHRHKSSRHDRHDRHDKDDKHDRDEKHDREEKYDRKDDRKDKRGRGEPDAIVEKKAESQRHAEKDSDRKSIRDSRSRRKPSYKYEDEEDLERRAERDREAERWGGVKK